MNSFGCTKYKYDTAHKWQQEYGPLSAPQKEKIFRKKMNLDAAKHFLEFLFTSELIQDIAYGTNTLIYSGGQKQLLPKSKLTMARSHTIKAYKKYCESLSIPVNISDTSLWNILNELKPSQRHALGGLDDISNSGLEGFSKLQQIISKLPLSKEVKDTLIKGLKNGQKYLKFGFTQHCTNYSNTDTHCISCALYDPDDKDFQPDSCARGHESVCMDCIDMFTTLDSIDSEIKKMTRIKQNSCMIINVA